MKIVHKLIALTFPLVLGAAACSSKTPPPETAPASQPAEGGQPTEGTPPPSEGGQPEGGAPQK
jgi:hypothetical protein